MNRHAVKKVILALGVLVFSMTVGAQVAPKTPDARGIQSSLHAGLIPAFNSIDDTAVLNFFNSRPVPHNAYRVLFIGDSLTLHERAPNLWDVWSGMAATMPAHDFVHLTASHMQSELATRPVEIFYDNGGNGKLLQMLSYLKDHPELKPSLVILQGGENDPFDTDFKTTYTALLDYFRASKVPIVVLSDFWSARKKDFEQEEALDRSLLFIDINAIQENPAMSGDGGPYNVPGVAAHPNNKGMRAIAGAINSRFDTDILPYIGGAHSEGKVKVPLPGDKSTQNARRIEE